ncbi:MAG: hypothetical protein EAX86_12360 [Candidatus Heimdallarchaeota archaeon]|nr:hypothetical protein [Candidatus Heimdallarchaeota archaeon]
MRTFKNVTYAVSNNIKFHYNRFHLMKIIENSLLDDLQLLGLTLNEAKALIALIKLGSQADAPKIAQLSKVPRTKIYKVLEGLEERDIVNTSKIEGTANLYRLISPPDQIITDLCSNLVGPINDAAARSADTIVNLTSTLKDESEGIHQVWVIKGQSHITRILREQIENASIEIISNAFPVFIKQVLEALTKAQERGVDIKLIMLDEEVDQLPDKYRELLAKNITGVSFEHLSQFIDFIPEEFRDILQLFGELLLTRPNVLLIDPATSNAMAFLYLQSETDPEDITVLQVINQDFIAFTIKLMKLIYRFAGAAKVIQTHFTQE